MMNKGKRFKIPLKTLTEKALGGQEIRFDYAEIMIDMLRRGGAQGITIGQMKDRLDALNAIEQAQKGNEDYVVIAENGLVALREAKDAYRFGFAMFSALEFSDDIDSAPEVEE